MSKPVQAGRPYYIQSAQKANLYIGPISNEFQLQGERKEFVLFKSSARESGKEKMGFKCGPHLLCFDIFENKVFQDTFQHNSDNGTKADWMITFNEDKTCDISAIGDDELEYFLSNCDGRLEMKTGSDESTKWILIDKTDI